MNALQVESNYDSLVRIQICFHAFFLIFSDFFLNVAHLCSFSSPVNCVFYICVGSSSFVSPFSFQIFLFIYLYFVFLFFFVSCSQKLTLPESNFVQGIVLWPQTESLERSFLCHLDAVFICKVNLVFKTYLSCWIPSTHHWWTSTKHRLVSADETTSMDTIKPLHKSNRKRQICVLQYF